ncbi:alpha/beta hydrolase family protein [Streptomyces sp. Je 1-369]|uniref:alpha/beta hydrolase family protein n=1 Tax=Streptomyces sp. Je 1-369 TaxID=2966192 RepID=UPI002286BEA8|nr:lipase [Streptomyces sp. Je 1-369]WAL93237.1 lipase [Streptomyces sp. Je 1-369]
MDAYRLVYRTIDAKGQPTTASGLFTVPRGVQGRLRTVSFAHGTGVHRIDAPSMQRKVFLSGPSITYASAGFAAVAPDYLGMGTGLGKHPWMDVLSEATASLDLLRAVRQFAPRTGRALDRDVLATGFSQGASAALRFGRALQAGEDRHFRLDALAPISGAYDFGGAEIPALLAGDGELEPRWGVVYTAYTLVAFDRVQDVYDNPGEVFRDPAVEELFDGMHTGPQLISALPHTLDELLTPYGRDLLARPEGGLAAGLRKTDSVCKDWKPKAPIRLYMARGDEQATVQNTANCAAAFRERGMGVPVVDLGAVDHQKSRHLGSNVQGTAEAVRWFSTLRTGGNPGHRLPQRTRPVRS